MRLTGRCKKDAGIAARSVGTIDDASFPAVRDPNGNQRAGTIDYGVNTPDDAL